MGRRPCCQKGEMKKGAWTALEDKILTDYITAYGEGLKRCGKSCRLRWLNYLRPDIKRGNITPDEEDLIIRLHGLLGNRWSLIAGRLPGRTDNEIKNYWNCCLAKRIRKENNREHIYLPNKVKNTKNPKIPTPGPELEENGHRLVPSPAVAAASLQLLLPLPKDPILNSGSVMNGDIVNDLPTLEDESGNVSSSPLTSRDDLSSHIVAETGTSDIFDSVDFSTFDDFLFKQFDSVIEAGWSSWESFEEADISHFGPVDYAALSYASDQWII
ncbi:hypothetical protein CRG98_009530 [Punica granatum]|uniref:Uncharacterized protein n=1 Tax=Punica granatum TaxID=22663 RepID=A0A2I0KNJ3_PUNGR|nr:hypothetical protein CRG98_009530 [Punica granatum]